MSGKRIKGQPITPSEITYSALPVIRQTQLWVAKEVERNPSQAFDEIALANFPKKKMVWVDLYAEREAINTFRNSYNEDEVLILGEESLAKYKDLDLSGEKRVVILMDMIDGTDLLVRGFSNWCSALVIYHQGKILGAAVGLPTEGIFFAYEGEDGAFLKPPGRKDTRRVLGPSKTDKIKNANICFYGQKPKNLLATIECKGFQNILKSLAQEDGSTRIYNLAGNPMMMRLIDGKTRVDAVFDLFGQHPHDVVPGAYIAKKANAVFGDISGSSIDLVESLKRPSSTQMRYILSSTQGLFDELKSSIAKSIS